MMDEASTSVQPAEDLWSAENKRRYNRMSLRVNEYALIVELLLPL